MYKYNRLSLLSSNARVQVPWVKVTIGEYTFGIFSKQTINSQNLLQYRVQFPNYIQSLTVTKINGQVNQYALSITYPVTQNDDPNFFEKVFSSVSKTRKIIFSYGDESVPDFSYRNEEAFITTIRQTFDLNSSTIGYTVNAISGAALNSSDCASFIARQAKPSDVIKEVFNTYNLANVFTGMRGKDLSYFIASTDTEVNLDAKVNISVMDYINYLVSCMYRNSNDMNNPQSIYILTIHDESSFDYYDNVYYKADFGPIKNSTNETQTIEMTGPYFKVSEVNYTSEKSDAYELDIGYNTSTIVTQFSLENNENYALYYNNQLDIARDTYVRRINDQGQIEEIESPTTSSKNEEFITRPEDKTWWTKITQFPVNASITVQGLLRPAKLLTYIRLNIIFPGGHKHIGSGLYIITKQVDTIDYNGYRTQLSLTKVGGDLLKKIIQ